MIYLFVFCAVLLTNLLPALAPPTWAILVLFRFHTSVNSWALLFLGVFGAVLGRYLLARLFSILGSKLSPHLQVNLRAAGEVLETRQSLNILTLLFFAFSPISTAQLFEAAGLIRIKLRPLLLAFTVGRTISYSSYVFGAGALQHVPVGKTLLREISSPWALGLQVVLLIGFIPLTRIKWQRFRKHQVPGA